MAFYNPCMCVCVCVCIRNKEVNIELWTTENVAFIDTLYSLPRNFSKNKSKNQKQKIKEGTKQSLEPEHAGSETGGKWAGNNF